MADPIRVPLSELKANPGGYLESARQRRVLLTRRGKVVGELIPLDEPPAAPLRPLLGAGRDLLRLDPTLDLTEPAQADWPEVDLAADRDAATDAATDGAT